ncbi:MAG: (2Fe-2S)-binding protein [Gammaproteobacteria bacterium]
MNAINPGPPVRNNDIICHCSGTTKQKIVGLIDNGADSLEILARLTGAGAGCGACEDSLRELLDEHSALPVESDAVAANDSLPQGG